MPLNNIVALQRDTRAVTPVLGAVLLAGILILLIAGIQSQAVPMWNEEIEFDHSQRVTGDMEELRSTILSVASRGISQSVTVELGTAYPQRFVLRNYAPDPAGSLSTEPPDTLAIDNMEGTDETADYWDGDQKNFSTQSVVYEPNYNHFNTAPVTIYENTILHNQFDTANIVLTEQNLINDNRITLITVNGTLNAQGASDQTIDTIPTSAPMQTISVENNDGPITIRIPTHLPNSTWSEILAEEYTSNGGHIIDQSFQMQSPQNLLILELEPDVTYELRMGQVGVGTNINLPEPYYIVRDSDSFLSTDPNNRARIVVEVRDRYNNPVSNANVTFTTSAGSFEDANQNGLTDPTTVRTNDEGNAVLWHNSTDLLGVHDVFAYLGSEVNESIPEREQVEYQVVSGGGSDPGSSFVISENVFALGCTGGQTCTGLSFTLNNTASTEVNITGFKIDHITTLPGGNLEDGPDAVTRIELVGEPPKTNLNLIEGRAPVFFEDDPLIFQPGIRNFEMEFDETFRVQNTNDAIAISFELYFEGGFSARYSVWLFGTN